MRTEKEIKKRIEDLQKDKREVKLNYLEGEGIFNAINIYTIQSIIDTLNWVLDKEVSE